MNTKKSMFSKFVSFLSANRGLICGYRPIAESLWGSNPGSCWRENLGTLSARAKEAGLNVITVRGVGYLLQEENSEIENRIKCAVIPARDNVKRVHEYIRENPYTSTLKAAEALCISKSAVLSAMSAVRKSGVKFEYKYHETDDSIHGYVVCLTDNPTGDLA
jgi:ElaB/YqjD/DUF883 family membrane-anchored ribosome-binding protein